MIYRLTDPLSMNPAEALADMRRREYDVMVSRTRKIYPATFYIKRRIEVTLGIGRATGGPDISSMTHQVY